MRFASIQDARAATERAIFRFPVAVLCSWIAAVVSDWMVVADREDRGVVAIVMAAALGVPLAFALALFRERRPATAAPWKRYGLDAVALAGLVAFVLIWPHMTDSVQARSFAQLVLFALAVAATLPFLGVREPRGFWQYGRVVLIRLVVASVFAGVLHVGLQGALFALKPLFGISISGKSFFLLASFVYFGFLPLYFFAGIPRDLAELDRQDNYPAVVRVLAAYILVPLVAVYQTLLTAYLFRIIVTGQWPSGVIGWLVSAEASFGIVALLLVWPVRDRAENRWVGIFSRVFYVALLPSIAMLGLAIGKRIAQYGVTEDRYFVAVMAAWLAGISGYFIARRDGDIRWIPATLGLLAVLTLAGPWSAYSVSLASQQQRLVRILREHGLRLDAPPGQPASLETRRNLSSLFDYLFKTHGLRAVTQVLGPAAVDTTGDSAMTSGTKPDHSRRTMTRLGLAYAASWEGESSGTVFFRAPTIGPRIAEPVAGYDLHVRLEGGFPQPFRFDGRDFVLRLEGRSGTLVLEEGRQPISTFSLERALAVSTTLPSAPDTMKGGLHIEGQGSRRALLVVASFSAGRHDSLIVYEMGHDLYLADAPTQAVSVSADTLTASR